MASYDYMIQEEIPNLINDLRPIVWVEKPGDGSTLCLTIRTRYASLSKPMLNANQILLPLQAQQLGRSYSGKLLINVEISVKQTLQKQVLQQQVADIKDLWHGDLLPAVTVQCLGEIPVLVGSCLCHQRSRSLDDNPMCYFIAPDGGFRTTPSGHQQRTVQGDRISGERAAGFYVSHGGPD